MRLPRPANFQITANCCSLPINVRFTKQRQRILLIQRQAHSATMYLQNSVWTRAKTLYIWLQQRIIRVFCCLRLRTVNLQKCRLRLIKQRQTEKNLRALIPINHRLREWYSLQRIKNFC